MRFAEVLLSVPNCIADALAIAFGPLTKLFQESIVELNFKEALRSSRGTLCCARARFSLSLWHVNFARSCSSRLRSIHSDRARESFSAHPRKAWRVFAAVYRFLTAGGMPFPIDQRYPLGDSEQRAWRLKIPQAATESNLCDSLRINAKAGQSGRAPSFPKAPSILMAISRILFGRLLNRDDHLSQLTCVSRPIRLRAP